MPQIDDCGYLLSRVYFSEKIKALDEFGYFDLSGGSSAKKSLWRINDFRNAQVHKKDSNLRRPTKENLNDFIKHFKRAGKFLNSTRWTKDTAVKEKFEDHQKFKDTIFEAAKREAQAKQNPLILEEMKKRGTRVTEAGRPS